MGQAPVTVADDGMGYHAEDAVLQLTFETIHHRADQDQRHDANRDPEGGKQRNKRSKTVVTARSGVTQANSQAYRLKDSGFHANPERCY